MEKPMFFAKGALLGIGLSVLAVITYWATPGKNLSTIKMSFTIVFIVLAVAVTVIEMAIRGFTMKPPARVARFFVGMQTGIALSALLVFWGVNALMAHYARLAQMRHL
jgi:hypothetical protein